MPRAKAAEEEGYWGGRRPGAGRKPTGTAPLRPGVSIKCGPLWVAWLARFAEKEGKSMVAVIALALKSYASKRRFEPPPDREA